MGLSADVGQRRHKQNPILAARPIVTFPVQAPPPVARSEDVAISVISDEHRTASIHSWAVQPNADPVTDDPISFEFDNKPFTVNPILPNLKRKGLDAGERSALRDCRNVKLVCLRVGEPELRDCANATIACLRVSPILDDVEKQISSSARDTSNNSEASLQKKTQVSHLGSFCFGLFLGLIPVLIVLRLCQNFFGRGQSNYEWHQEWLRNGKTLGLFMLVTIVIVLITLNIR